METISLLWKNKRENVEHVDEVVLNDMGIMPFIEAVFSDETQREFAKKRMMELVTQEETIKYRQEIFAELYENADFLEEMENAVEKLKIYEAIQSEHIVLDKKSSLLELTGKLNELCTYIEVILALDDCLRGRDLHAEGFLRIKELVSTVSREKGFSELRDDIHDVMEEMSEYRSITLGLNLDAMLNIKEVVFLSVNDYTYQKKMPMLARFGRFLQEAAVTGQGMEDGVVFMTRKTDQTKQDPVMKNLVQLMGRDVEKLTQKMFRMLRNYVDLSGSSLVKLIPELHFYIGFAKFFRKAKALGYPICMPEIKDCEQNRLQIKKCYNVKLLLDSEKEDIIKEKVEVVYNDFELDERGKIFILTGPNSGGKTTYTQAVGGAVLLAQQGLAVFAEEYKGSIFDKIFTHFPASEEDTLYYGRLGEESKRISAFMKHVTSKSFVFLNETYSSTSFSEGMFLARDLLAVLQYKHASAIYNTHMHELAENLEELNKEETETRIDSLVMGRCEDGKRSYKVYRKQPEKNSYARDIALKYGVTYAQLIQD